MSSRVPGLGIGPVPTPAAKLRIPAPGPGAVRRAAVIELLEGSRASVVLVAAPAGFGKTTAVAQWCRERGGLVAWMHLDFTDRDPLVLMSTVLAALRNANSITAEALESLEGLTADEPAFSRWVLSTFRTVVESAVPGTLLVMDDVHDAITPEGARVINALVDSLQGGSRLVLVGRRRPVDLSLARWGVQGHLQEVGPERLALSYDEVAAVVANVTGSEPDEESVRAIGARTDGWPVAVYLSCDPVAEAPSGPEAREDVRAYLVREVIESVDPLVADFLVKTSVLGALSAPLCDHVVGGTQSRKRMREASADTMLFSPLGGEGGWYRLHPLIREALAAEYEAAYPDAARVAYLRASAWYDERGFAEEALAHACRAGDTQRIGELVWRYGLSALLVGRASTVQGWIDNALGSVTTSEVTAALAMTAAWTAMMQGRGADVVRWTDVAASLLGPDWETRATNSDVEPAVATLVATRMTMGHHQSSWYAGNAYALLPSDHPLRPLARLVQGWSVTLGGDVVHGTKLMDHSASLSESMGLATTWVEALALKSIAEWSAGDTDLAAESVSRATEVWLEHSLVDANATTILLCCAATAIHAARREHDAVRVAMARSADLAAAVETSLPWVGGLRTVIDASAYVDMGDVAAGAPAVDRARRALAQLPASPFLSRTLSDVEARLTRSTVSGRLTPAEMRVADRLDSPLGASAIADDLGVSYETVKSHLASIYRKLGVSSRQEAAATLRGPRDT